MLLRFLWIPKKPLRSSIPEILCFKGTPRISFICRCHVFDWIRMNSYTFVKCASKFDSAELLRFLWIPLKPPHVSIPGILFFPRGTPRISFICRFDAFYWIHMNSYTFVECASKSDSSALLRFIWILIKPPLSIIPGILWFPIDTPRISFMSTSRFLLDSYVFLYFCQMRFAIRFLR